MQELKQLADDIRTELSILSKTNKSFVPSLSVVELTVAIHHVFHAPVDKILWDMEDQVRYIFTSLFYKNIFFALIVPCYFKATLVSVSMDYLIEIKKIVRLRCADCIFTSKLHSLSSVIDLNRRTLINFSLEEGLS